MAFTKKLAITLFFGPVVLLAQSYTASVRGVIDGYAGGRGPRELQIAITLLLRRDQHGKDRLFNRLPGR